MKTSPNIDFSKYKAKSKNWKSNLHTRKPTTKNFQECISMNVSTSSEYASIIQFKQSKTSLGRSSIRNSE